MQQKFRLLISNNCKRNNDSGNSTGTKSPAQHDQAPQTKIINKLWKPLLCRLFQQFEQQKIDLILKASALGGIGRLYLTMRSERSAILWLWFDRKKRTFVIFHWRSFPISAEIPPNPSHIWGKLSHSDFESCLRSAITSVAQGIQNLSEVKDFFRQVSTHESSRDGWRDMFKNAWDVFQTMFGTSP